MNAPYSRQSTWAATLAWVILVLLIGAGLTIWGLSRWEAGARFLGLAPTPPSALALQPVTKVVAPVAGAEVDPAEAKAVIEPLVTSSGRTTLEWIIPAGLMPKRAVKILLNLVLLANDALVLRYSR